MNGCSIVRRRGETLFIESEGVADPRTGEVVSPATRFQIASISKGFTAAAVLRLLEEGRLSLDSTIERWFEHAPSIWSKITVHQLLTHTSGLGHWDDYKIDPAVPLEAAAEIELFRTLHLFPPGTGWAYSSPGYVLLARIVEQTTGRSYHDFLRTEVIERSGLSSSFAGNARGRANVAAGLKGGEPVESFELDVVNAGAGDVWCTADDLALWNERAATGHVLSPDATRLFMKGHTPVPESDRAYGYGWVVGPFEGRPAVFHQGGNAGFRAISLWFPCDRMSVVVLSNEGETDPDALAAGLLAATAEQP